MIIQLQANEVKDEKYDIDFPIYSKDNISSTWEIFKKVEYSGQKHLGRDCFIGQFKATTIQITIVDNTDEELEGELEGELEEEIDIEDIKSISVEVDEDYHFNSSDCVNKNLGLGAYSCTEKKFNEILNKVYAKVKSIEVPPVKKKNLLTSSAIKFFISEVNKEISLLGEIELVEGRLTLTFEVFLKVNEFFEKTQFTVSKKFIEKITELSKKYFNEVPSFNNTHSVFWFKE